MVMTVLKEVQIRFEYHFLPQTTVKNNIRSLVVTAGSKSSLIRLEAKAIFVTQMWLLMQTFELLLAWVGK